MTNTPILAIDLGKYKCVSCAYDRGTAAADSRTITTSRAEIERLIRSARPAVVVWRRRRATRVRVRDARGVQAPRNLGSQKCFLESGRPGAGRHDAVEPADADRVGGG